MELSVMFYGVVGALSLWQYVILVILLTQLTIMAVTLYLHRQQAHGAIKLHPALEHFFRFWIWLTTGMKTDEWVAVHRKHHKRCEMPDDPHSPAQKGLGHVLIFGVRYYREAATLEGTRAYVQGAAGAMLPRDWVERKVYSKHNWLGLGLLFLAQTLLFGVPGVAVWLCQYLWIPIHAAGIINGVGHAIGYRNADTRNGDGTGPDASTNIVPWGLWIGGEELHNNHHIYPTSAKFSQRWFEVDIGWGVIRILRILGLAEVKHVSYMPKVSGKIVGSDELLRIFQHHRWLIAKWFRQAAEKEGMFSSELAKRFDVLLSARGFTSVTKEQFASWLDDVAASQRTRLVAFAQNVRMLRERIPRYSSQQEV
jgi:stearoyl-CoA desaturase (delta-9 desaturase)